MCEECGCNHEHEDIEHKHNNIKHPHKENNNLNQSIKLENIERNTNHTESEKFKTLKTKRQAGELKTEYERILEGSDDKK